MTALRLYPAVLGGATLLAALGAGYYLRKRRKTPEQLERERRLRISTHGRIIDGTVIDAQEVTNERGPVQLLIYRYDVSGVQYEASQDVTHLRQYVDIHTCKIGLPSSVKYDPQNPGDSIVISEQWSGLRLNPVIPLKRRAFSKTQTVK
jgi:hypothetical protein